MVVLVHGDTDVASWPLATARVDLPVIDGLARLQLAARRLGYSIQLRDPSGRLCELLDLTGLGQVVMTAAGLVVEVAGEPEGGEQLGVEEGVEPGDPLS
jgi:hypothetical protein